MAKPGESLRVPRRKGWWLVALASAVTALPPAQADHTCAPAVGDAALWQHCGVRPASWPLRIAVNPNAPDGIDLVAASQAAADTWNVFGEMLVVEGTTSRAPIVDGVNTIAYGNPGDCGVASAIAVFCPVIDDHTLVEFDIILNEARTWHHATTVEDLEQAVRWTAAATLVTSEWRDVQAVVTHELGHAIGLDDIGDRPGWDDGNATEAGKHLQTMYFSIRPGSTHARTLDVGDLAGLAYARSLG